MKQRAVGLLVGALLVLATLLCLPPSAWSTEPAPKRAQFVYLLRVLPAYHAPHAWTDKETAVIGQHFERLVLATASGQVILAGKTSEALHGDRSGGRSQHHVGHAAPLRGGAAAQALRAQRFNDGQTCLAMCSASAMLQTR